MTEVLHSPSSSSSPSISTPTHNPGLFHQTPGYVGDEGVSGLTGGETEEKEEEEEEVREKRDDDRRDQLSLLALFVTLFRKSFLVACKTDRSEFSGAGGNCGSGVMEISWPTDVQHVNHVTFDRFDGFLGLPVEFEPEVPRRAPSARYILLFVNLAMWVCLLINILACFFGYVVVRFSKIILGFSSCIFYLYDIWSRGDILPSLKIYTVSSGLLLNCHIVGYDIIAYCMEMVLDLCHGNGSEKWKINLVNDSGSWIVQPFLALWFSQI